MRSHRVVAGGDEVLIWDAVQVDRRLQQRLETHEVVGVVGQGQGVGESERGPHGEPTAAWMELPQMEP